MRYARDWWYVLNDVSAADFGASSFFSSEARKKKLRANDGRKRPKCSKTGRFEGYEKWLQKENGEKKDKIRGKIYEYKSAKTIFQANSAWFT